jgi:hypothetical protein
MKKDWLVQAAFPEDVYIKIKIWSTKWNLSIKKTVVQLVILGFKGAK